MTFIKYLNAIKKSYESNEPHRKCSPTCSYNTVDETVLKLITNIQDQNWLISGPLIKEKALGYTKHFRYNEFQASSLWLDKFKKIYGIKEKVISGESKTESEAVCLCDDWKSNDLKKF